MKVWASHHVLQAGHQLPDAGLQTVLVPLDLLQRRVAQSLRTDKQRSAPGSGPGRLQAPADLLDLGPHGGRDGGGGDKLEGGGSVVGILGWKLEHQVDLVAAKVGRHHAAAGHRVHLHHKTPRQ